MTNLITRLQSAPANDPDLFMEAYEMHAKQKGHEWRRRNLPLIRDRAFLEAASMFLCSGEDFHENSAFALGETEGNARLAMWLTVMEQAK